MKAIVGGALVLAFGCCLTFAQTPDYDLSRDFSMSGNPNGVWSYGRQETVGGTFTLFGVTQTNVVNGIPTVIWLMSPNTQPAIFHNDTTQTVVSGSATFPPETTWFAPGVQGNPGNYAVARFTVPAGAGGAYRLETSALPVYGGGQLDTDFHVTRNNVEVFGVQLNGTQTAGYTNTLSLAVGDTIDFAVGRGADNSYVWSALKIEAALTRQTNVVGGLTLVVPRSAETNDTTYGGGTFSAANFRHQQVYGSNEFPTGAILIRELRFRPDRVHGSAFTTTVANIQINLSTTRRNPSALSSTYAQNVGSNDTVVFQGSLPLSSQFQGPVNGPKAFDMVVPLSQPFSYDPAGGHLVIDVRNFSGSSASPLSGQTGPDNAWRVLGTLGSATGAVDTGADAIQIVYSLTNQGPPTITAHPTNQTVVVGGSATFSTTASGGVPLTYQWRRDATAIPGGTNTILSLTNVQLSQAGNYFVVVSNTSGVATSQVATLTVIGLPPAIVSHPTNQTVAEGSSVTLSVTATGSAPLEYQWRQDATAIPDATNSTLILTNVQFSQEGNYSVVVSNAFGVAASQMAILTVNPAGPDTNCVPVQNGLVSWWRAEGHAKDANGTNHGRAIGATFASGVRGQAFDFDGDARIAVPDSDSLEITPSLTVEGWLKIRDWPSQNSFGAAMVVFRGDDRSGFDAFYVTVLDTGVLRFAITAADAEWAAIDAPVVTNRFIHFAATIDDASGDMKLYLDGSLAAQTNTTVRPIGDLGPFGAGVGIGNAHEGSTFRFGLNGLVDELKLYSRALTSAEVQMLYTNAPCSQNTLTLVVPNVSATVDDGGGSGILRDVIRSQIIYDSSQFPPEGIRISELRMRPSATWGNAFTSTIPNFQINLSTTSVEADQMNAVLAQNVGSNNVIAFQGSMTVSSRFVGPVNGPKEFDIILPLSTPFVYDARLGNLLVDFRNFSGSSATIIDLGQQTGDGSARALAAVNATSASALDVAAEILQIVYTIETSVPPTIITQPTNQTVLVGSNVTFSVTATGTVPLRYQWRRDATAIPGATNSTLILTNVQLSQAGSYSVVVSNAFGVVTSQTATLTVNPPPLPDHDLSLDFSLAGNPNGVWSYGRQETVGGAFTLFGLTQTNVVNGIPTVIWLMSPNTQPAIFHNDTTQTVVSGSATFPPETTWFAPGVQGNPGNYAVARFTVPAGRGGTYQLVSTARPVYGASQLDTDFHVTRNNVEIFGAQLNGAQTAGYTNTLSLAVGDTIDFAVGRGADNSYIWSALKIESSLTRQTNVVSGLTLVVPRSAETNDTTYGGGAFSEANFRHQQVYGSNEFPGGPILIRELRFRPDRVHGNAFTTTVSNIRVKLSTTQRSPTGLSSSYADNAGPDDTIAFQGSLPLSSQFQGPVNGPKAFDMIVPLSQPFFYDPANGHLVVDLQNISGSSASRTSGQFSPDNAGRVLGALESPAGFVDDGVDTIQIVYSPATTTPPFITTHPTNQTVLEGSNVTFSVTATGSAPLRYQWRRDAIGIPNATNSTLILTNVQLSQAGNYSVVVSNAVGTAASQTAVLTVAPAPPPVDHDLSRDFSLAGNPNGVWSYGRQDTIGGAFTLLGTAKTNFANVPIILWAISGDSQPAIQHNDTTQTAVTDGGQGVYPPETTWFGPGPQGQPGNYAVARFTVPAGGDGSYQLVTTGRPGYSASLQLDTDFHVVRNNVEIFGVQLAGAQTAGYTNTLALVAGDTIDFAVGRGVDNSYIWSQLKVEAMLDRISSNGVPPIILSQPTNQTVVEGNSVTFSVTASGSAPLRYQWRRNAAAILNATNATLILTSVQFGQGGNYSVVVSNLVGTVTSQDAILTVNLAGPDTNCVPVRPGLVSWWRAEGSTRDSSGTNHGTVIGATFASGARGQAFSFNGDDRVAAPNSPTLHLTPSMSIEGWINIRDWPSNNDFGYGMVVFRGDDRPGLDPFYVVVLNTGVLRFAINSADNEFAGVEAPVVTNRFIHFAATLDDASGAMKLYVDGTLAAETTTALRPAGDLGSSVGVGIGNAQEGSHFNFGFNGLVDELKLYSRALSLTEVRMLYTNAPCPEADFDLSRDFSLSGNPNGAWSYGRQETIGGAFTLLGTAKTNYANVPMLVWAINSVSQPAILHNDTTETGIIPQGEYPPETTWFGPGVQGQPGNYAVARLTVPVGGDGTYQLVTTARPSFHASYQLDTDFHVARNNLEIFEAQLNGTQTASYTNTLALTAGDTVDFAVGRGADNSYIGSQLKVAATLTRRFSDLQPSVTNVIGGGRRFTLTFNGLLGNYTIEASTNLINWVTLTNVVGAAGQVHVSDPTIDSLRQRFYRARFSP